MRVKNQFNITIANRTIPLKLRFAETGKRLSKIRLADVSDGQERAVFVSERAFSDWAAAGNAIDGFAEFCLLCMPVSEALLSENGCIFHAAAFSFREKAWLIAAGSGVGKSTQIRTLMELYPEEISVINGDKPALLRERDDEESRTRNLPSAAKKAALREADIEPAAEQERNDCGKVRHGESTGDRSKRRESVGRQRIIVYPSPWNGKEGWHGAGAAELAGIFLLTRGKENAIDKVTPQQAAPFVLSGIFQSYETEQTIRAAAAMAEQILKSAPVWRLTSLNVPDSTKLLYETMRDATFEGLPERC